jgi:hypothetical protein
MKPHMTISLTALTIAQLTLPFPIPFPIPLPKPQNPKPDTININKPIEINRSDMRYTSLS